MIISLTMLCLGLILGFVGAGGSGFIIAILVTFFNIPIHTALGTAVAVMFFSVLSGSWSHFREGNLLIKQGLYIGLFGAIGAYLGTQLTKFIQPEVLLYFTVASLMLSGVLLWLKTIMKVVEEEIREAHKSVILRYLGIGFGNGLISGTFGIGAASFIQLSLMKWLRYPMIIAAGTTMLVILPIAMSASLGFMQNGYFEIALFLKVAIGTIVGTYFGAKLTNKLPQVILRYSMILTPVVSALIMMLDFF